jgi:hypothetical protein
MAAVPFAVLAPCGQSENFWIHPATYVQRIRREIPVKILNGKLVKWYHNVASIARFKRRHSRGDLNSTAAIIFENNSLRGAYLLTPWCWIYFEELIVTQIVKQ